MDVFREKVGSLIGTLFLNLKVLRLLIFQSFLRSDENTVREISDELDMPIRSIRHYMRKCGLSVGSRFSDISSTQLKNYVYQIVTENTNLGEVSIRSRLCALGFKVQRQRVRDTIKNTACHLVQPRKIIIRKYKVRAPLSLLHIDGKHKLIKYVH